LISKTQRQNIKAAPLARGKRTAHANASKKNEVDAAPHPADAVATLPRWHATMKEPFQIKT